MPRFYVAMDGGGTKTDAVLFDDTGRVIKRTIGGSTSPSALTDEQLEKNFSAIFTDLFSEEQPPVITRCFTGTSGANHPILNGRLTQIMEKTLPVPCESIQVENDALNALWSGTDGAPGVVVIAGTGSIAYGCLADGSKFRIGGWGHLVGDDGSGYYIGKEAVRAALRAHDGIEQPAPLYGKIMKHFNIGSMPDVIPIVYSSNKTTLSNLAPIVIESAKDGDPAAVRILENSARYLAELIEAALVQFNEPNVPVVLVGGLWHSDLIRTGATEGIRASFIMPKYPPVYGSMVGALGKEADNSILYSLKAFFKE